MVSDDPAKVLDKARPGTGVAENLQDLLGVPEKEVDLVSPYFVPGKSGTQAFAELARKGVGVRILTNALEATDVAAVHAGYAKWRKPLLEAGVLLYESRRSWERAMRANRRAASAVPPRACMQRPLPSTTSASSSARSTSTRARSS